MLLGNSAGGRAAGGWKGVMHTTREILGALRQPRFLFQMGLFNFWTFQRRGKCEKLWIYA
jgi:hypothetical protein